MDMELWMCLLLTGRGLDLNVSFLFTVNLLVITGYELTLSFHLCLRQRMALPLPKSQQACFYAFQFSLGRLNTLVLLGLGYISILY